jgi:hypothetical protein
VKFSLCFGIAVLGGGGGEGMALPWMTSSCELLYLVFGWIVVCIAKGSDRF